MIILLFNVSYKKKETFSLGGNMAEKTLQLLAYIIKKNPKVSITGLMKLSYLVDLVNIRKTKNKVSDFEYIRYNYGPFDNKIYRYINELIDKNIISQDVETSFKDDYSIYKANDDNEEGDCHSLLEQTEKESVEEVSNSLMGLGATALTKVAYKTKPMQKLKAEIGNKKGLGKKLDLFAI